jgi:hypothetical protein
MNKILNDLKRLFTQAQDIGKRLGLTIPDVNNLLTIGGIEVARKLVAGLGKNEFAVLAMAVQERVSAGTLGSK